MAEFKTSNIQLEEPDLRIAIEFYAKAIQRQINTTTDKDINAILDRKLRRFQQALMTINQLELIPKKN